MFKKIIPFILVVCMAQNHAETCPTPNAILHHSFEAWQVFDIDNGTPISSSRLEQFSKNVAQFALAEWMEDAPEGEAHCYYYGASPQPDYLGVYLAKSSLLPDKMSETWKPQGPYVMRCTGNIEGCHFIKK
jgi:hypothetical protein